jgi:hypothetical protein
MTLKLLKNEVQDTYSRENFKRIEDYTRDLALLRGNFKFFTFELSAKTYPATVIFRHNLGFAPKDILPTSILGGTVTWNYSLFSIETISATISAPVTVRCFLGRYGEERTI